MRLLLLSLLLLPACGSGDDTGPYDPNDFDGDGVPASEDCDDEDPDVGRPTPWYRDADDDGFGDPDRSQEGCDRPSGWVDNAVDCDDADPSMPILVDGERGSDANSGGPDDPLATLDAALATGAGCIALRPGTYHGQWALERSVRIGSTSGAEDTVLDADGGGPVFTVQAGSLSLWDVTVTGGTGLLVGDHAFGGGIYAWEADALEIDGCVFRGNAAGYGAAVLGPETGTLTARDTLFTGNTASGSGGGVWAVDAEISNCRIEGNTAQYGGGGFFMGGEVHAEGTTFSGNTATTKGGGAWVEQEATLVGGTFDGNTADVEGGGLYTRTEITLQDVAVTGNEAESGGGISCERGLTLIDATVTGNTASQEGGGIFATGDLDARDVLVSDNTAQMGGGMLLQQIGGTFSGVEITGNTGGVNGGGLYLYRCTLDLGDTRIAENEAPYGAGVDLDGGTITATGVSIAGNVAGNYAGGIYVYNVASWTGGTVEDNEAPTGAGIYADAYGTRIADVTVTSNSAAQVGGGVFVDEDVTLERVVVLGNSARQAGAGIEVSGAEATLEDCSVLRNASDGKGGGARVSEGTLRSQASDWGEGGDDNAPDDVWDGATAYDDFGAGESFTCTARTGCH